MCLSATKLLALESDNATLTLLKTGSAACGCACAVRGAEHVKSEHVRSQARVHTSLDTLVALLEMRFLKGPGRMSSRSRDKLRSGRRSLDTGAVAARPPEPTAVYIVIEPRSTG